MIHPGAGRRAARARAGHAPRGPLSRPASAGRLLVAAALALASAGLAVASAAAPAGAAARPGHARSAITQPAPPVTASAFPLERQGKAPADGDGLIPNPATPTGAPAGPPASCTVSFSSGSSTSATVNAWIAAHQNSITATAVVCLSGTFTAPLHVWGKTATPLLEIAPAPGQSATLSLGSASSADSSPNQFYTADSGGISIVDSRSVEVYGMTIQNYTTFGTSRVPAGIYVSARSDTSNTNQNTYPHLSACFLNGGACSDIYLIANTVQNITNTADQTYNQRSVCGNGNVNSYGVAVIVGGSSTSQQLQHLVIENNTVTGTRTGQSETVTINGGITDYLVAGNVIHDDDNIGIDNIGWETGTSQASHGYVDNNTVYNIDTWSNAAYGSWKNGKCVASANNSENAGGIYEDGARYLWMNGNTVWNTNQGINLDVELPGKSTDHLLVSGNVVHDDPGTSKSVPSYGTNPPGTTGQSTVAGHDPFGLYIDAFGSGSTISSVYVHDNTIQNESQYFLSPSFGMPSVDIGGKWSNLQIWHNTIAGMGASDRYNPLLQLDNQPSGGRNVIDCNSYASLSTSQNTVNGNFALPANNWLTLADWQHSNGHSWDADSQVGGFSPGCPSQSIQ